MSYASYGYGAGAYGYGGFGVEDYSSGTYNPRYHFQAAQNAGFELGTTDGQPRTLYVGNLDPSVTEEFIATLFGQIGPVTKTKVIFDTVSDPYAFVEFSDHYTATQALQAMNKRLLLDKEMKVNWATQPGTQQKVDTSKHFHVFVGDLSPEVDNKALKDAFVPFGEVSDAKVIRDPTTLKSKGYGFVSYPKREEAERAIEQMNGQWLGRRTIRTNWATRKPTGGSGSEMYSGKPTLEEIYSMTGPENSSVYVGNVPQNCSEDDIRQAFKKYGSVLDIRHFKPQGYAFVRFDSKNAAAKAIVDMNGEEFMGQTVRCAWGKTDVIVSSTKSNYGGVPSGRPDLHAQFAGQSAANIMAAASANNSAATAAQMQQYWNYYQQYFQQNPQLQQQWASYWQQQQQQPQQNQSSQ